MESNYNEFNQIKFEKKYIISKRGNKQNFDILSSSREISSLEFELVDEFFLSSKNIDENLYINKYIFNFEIDGKNYILFPNEYILLEKTTNKNLTQENKASENKVSCKVSQQDKENRIKNLIQLYIEKLNILKLFENNINNEKDMKEYYLINKNWIRFYEEQSNYKKIEEKLKSMDVKNLNFEQFLRNNYDEISNEIKDLIGNCLKEENFCLENELEFSDIKESKDLLCPNEFILTSEKLFDSLYKEIIKSNKYKKDDYKYKTIIGDNVLFIPDKKHDNIFYAFTKDKNNIDLLSYLLKYNDKNMFFDDIKNYIQNKGFDNYLIEKNIHFHRTPKLEILYNQDNEKIGEYINYKTLDESTYKKMKIKNILHQSKKFYLIYKKIYDKITNFNKNLNLSTTINEINNKQNTNNYFDVIVILHDEFINLKNNLFFHQVEELLKLNDKKEEQKIKLEKMINELANNPSYNYDDKNYAENIKLIYPNEILQNNRYNLINKDFFISINNSQNFINSLSEFYYFMSNNEKYVFYPKEEKLYKVEFDNINNYFKLKECELSLEYIIEALKDLNKIETNIEKRIKSTSLKNIFKSDSYYLVNKNWIKEFKTFFNYDDVIRINANINNLFKKEKFPDKLNNINYLNTELDKNLYNDSNVPINFEIFNKANFDLIIKQINKKYKIKLKFKCYYSIYLGDNRIFIQDNDNKFLYFIYLLNNKEYILKNIIKFNQIDNIKKFISKCENNEKFEDLINKYGIDLSSQDNQYIIDNNDKLIGSFKIINSSNINNICKLNFEREYLNGKRNTKEKECYEREYYNKDKLKYEGGYLNGKRNGKGKEYYNNGKLEFEGEYLNGERNGKGKEYNYHNEFFSEII